MGLSLSKKLYKNTKTKIKLYNNKVEDTKKVKQDTNKNITVVKETGVVKGDIILKRFRHLFWKRSLNKHQHIIGEIYLLGNLENIYGDDFKDHELRIKKENKINKVKPFAFVGCPRRWGKTFVTAWFVACALATFDGIRIIVFAPALRQCLFFIEEVNKSLDFIKEQGGINYKILEKNKQNLTILPQGGTKPNSVQSLPCKETTVRGVGAGMVIGEELSSIPLSFVLSVMLPLLTVARTSFVGISTVKGEDNHFFKFLCMYDPDDRHSPINVYQFYAACSECRKSGNAISCKHLLADQPKWVTVDRKTSVQKMYANVGGDDMCDQELSGVVKQQFKNAFDPILIDRLFEERNVIFDSYFFVKPTMIYSVIDPTGGGASDLAIASGVCQNGIFTYTGLESITAFLPEQCFPQILKHYAEMRKHALLSGCYIYIWIEGNMVWQANEIYKFLSKHLRRAYLMDNSNLDVSSVTIGNASSTGNGKVGFLTDHQLKMKMMVTFRLFLAGDRLKFWDKLVSVHHPNISLESTMSARNCTRDMMKNQFKNWFIQIQPALNKAFGKDKITSSGKSQNGTSKDDLGLVGQAILVCQETLLMNPNMGRLELS